MLRGVLDGGQGFNRFRTLPVDEARGNPLHSWGAVHASRLGTYWTVPVEVPLVELTSLRPVLQSRQRVASVRAARLTGKDLPPIELSVYPDGSAWIVDGNHRLIEARQAKLPSLQVTFTFVGR